MPKAILLFALVLGGCAGDFLGRPTVAEVQAIGVRECAFLPTREATEKVIAAWSAQPNTSPAIASAICSAVQTKRRGTVAGVAIEGLTVR